MDLNEYQAKELLARFDVPVPRGEVAASAAEAEQVASRLEGPVWVVKAQIRAGDRGRAGGVKLVRSPGEAGKAAAGLLDRILVTPQTGPAGMRVARVYVEQAVEVARELYLGVVVDRTLGRVMLMASTAGGTRIEEVAADAPERILRVHVDTDQALDEAQARELAAQLELEGAAAEAAVRLMRGACRAFAELDASLIEINPLALTGTGELVALDVKMSLDENALSRHPELDALRGHDGDDPRRLERERHGFNYVKLDGDIGCVVTGAGLALATMDMIKLVGGEPADFLDLPPTATRVQVAAAFRRVLEDADVRAVLVNAVGGGMTRCDIIADGLTTAAREVRVRVPVVVRFTGTSRDMGIMLLQNSRFAFVPAYDLEDAARKVVKAARGTS